MPRWNDLTDAERERVIASVQTDEQWDPMIALTVYNAIREMLEKRS